MNTGRIVNEKLFGKTELKSEKVELGYLDNVAKDAEKALSKYQDTQDIVSTWQKVSRQITDMNTDVKYIRKNRKAFKKSTKITR